MKEGFRQSMSWLHTWIGLVAGWVLYFIYLTGTLGYVDKEIDYWMTPDRPHFAQPGTQREQLAMAQKRLQQVAPQAASWNIRFRDPDGLVVELTAAKSNPKSNPKSKES
jgi:uncharacterized iron-regulated membrane protein